MLLNRLGVRRIILVLATLAVLGVYVARLMDIQIVQAEDIRARLEAGSTSRQTVKATRGEIVDRNGVSLVSNSLGYDVIFDRAFLPSAEQNDIILALIRMFEQSGTKWIDNLPVSTAQPFAFLSGYDEQVAILKEKYLGIQDYANVEETMFRLIEKYKLEAYSAGDARKIAGVRYEMERRDFSEQTPYTFASGIAIDLVLKIKESSYALKGVDISTSAIRHYDKGTIAPHLIGRVGRIYAEQWPDYKERGYAMDDIVGINGAEAAFEEHLRGVNGERLIMKDASGRVVDAYESTPPVPGNTIVLTLDARLQDVAQRALEAQIQVLQQTSLPGKGKEADKGAVVAIHPRTGQVLACATYPSYDLNAYLQDYSQLASDELLPLLNRALQGVYAPGSTFKPVVGTAGLATGYINEMSTVFCGMTYTRFQDYQPKCLRADGNINVTRALMLSCNIFFYDVGWNIGIDTMNRYAMQYGLGEPTGIELYEETGRRSNPEAALAAGEKWGNGAVIQSAIGQLYHGYTPLQLANYTATIANRGQRMKATIVREIRDYAQENVVQPFQAEVAQVVNASPEVYDVIVRGMVNASRSGTASAHFANYPFDVASKTGTPEDVQYPNSTFICFGPAEDPEIAIAVVIEKGWHGYTGAPVAKAIMDEYFGIQSSNPLLPREEFSTDEAARQGAQAAANAQPPAAGSQADAEEPSAGETAANGASRQEESGNGDRDSGREAGEGSAAGPVVSS